jgi:hypothetical protein
LSTVLHRVLLLTALYILLSRVFSGVNVYLFSPWVDHGELVFGSCHYQISIGHMFVTRTSRNEK